MIRWFLVSVLVFFNSTSALALEDDSIASDSCSSLLSTDIYRSLNVDQLQAGIRAFYSDDVSRFIDGKYDGIAVIKNLSDGRMGALTRKAMSDICLDLQSLRFAQPATGALDLVMEYGWLRNRIPSWSQLLGDDALLERLRNDAPGSWLKLAGSKEATQRYLTNPEIDTNSQVCDDLFAPIGAEVKIKATEEMEAGAIAIADALGLSTADPNRLVSACAVVGGWGSYDEISNTFSDYANISADVDSGLQRLIDPGFGSWWAQQPARTARLLFGSANAVKTLVSLYQPIRKQDIEVCNKQAVRLPDKDFTHYRFVLADEEDAKPSQIDLTDLVTQQFSSSRELAMAVAGGLGFKNDGCEFEIITQLLQRDEDNIRQYSLSKNVIDGLASTPETADLAAVLEDELASNASSLDELERSVVTSVDEKSLEAALAEINAIADLAAQVAEEVPLSNDTPLFRDDSESVRPDAPTVFTLTEQSMQQLLLSVQNPKIADALRANLYIEKSNRNEIRLSVVTLLAGVSAQELAKTTAEVQQLVQTSAVENWSISESLVEEITARSEFDRNKPVDPDELEELKLALDGISYVNRRLFEKSLTSPTRYPGEIPSLDQAQVNLLAEQSRISVDPDKERIATPLATSCGCGLRRGKHKQIYSVHPFWKWPLAESDDQEGPLLDFAYVDRIAFDGIVLSYPLIDSTQEPGFAAKHANHWYNAGGEFTKTAHKFETDVDLVFRIAGWEFWKKEHVASYAQEIAEILNFQKADSNWKFPSPEYSADPDGVALFFQSPGNETIDSKVVNIFFLELRKRLERRQQITVAFDIDLDSESPESVKIFRDFSEVLLDPENSIESDAEAVTSGGEISTKAPIDRVLVFLERPTTDAKKTLYTRILQMPEFRGSNRASLFRKIMPVVPPEANKELRRLNRNNQPVGADRNGMFKDHYGQFYDDLVFFDDNFSGIGFWPALYEDSPDPEYTEDIKSLINLRFNQYFYTTAFGVQYEPLDRFFDKFLTPACRYICPNRNVLYTVTLAFSVIIVLLLMLGLPTKYRQLIGHAIHYTFASIVTVLAAILICSQSELRMAALLIAMTLVTWKVYSVAVKPDDPLP